jgi:hypothetical protein
VEGLALMLSSKHQSQLSQTFSGLQVPDSAYGQAVPYVFGHCRISHKLIFWSNFQSAQQGGKKGGKGGSQTVYTVNADVLLGYGPFEGLGSLWINQAWQYVTYHNQTLTLTGTASSFTFSISPVGTFVMVMGVQALVGFSASFNDYGGFGITRSFSAAGTSGLPLYNANFPAPNYGTFAVTNKIYARYNLSYGSTSVTVTYPAPVTNPQVTVYWIENGGSDQPQNPNGGKKGGGGVPVHVPGLTFERLLGSGPSGNPQVFAEFSGAGGANIPLGPSPTLPYFNYEAKALYGIGNTAPVSSFNPATIGYLASTTSGDCCPADIIIDIVTSGNRADYATAGLPLWNHGLGFSAFVGSTHLEYAYSRFGGILADEPNTWAGGNNLGLNALRNYLMAYGIFISGSIDAQRSAADLLDELCKVSNCAPVWDGAGLDFIPYCEVSAYGNGTRYDAPTANGPVFNLTDKDLIALDDKSSLQLTIDRPSPNFNSLQVGFKDARQQFNDNYVIIADSMDITVQGAMPGSQESYPYITCSEVAQSVGWARLRRTLTVDRKEFRFSLPTFWEVILTPMTLITVLEPSFGANPVPVRIKTVDITVDKEGKRKMDVTAEPFIYGGSMPIPAPATGAAQANGGGTNGGQSAGSVNAPIFIETVPGLNPAAPQLWICVSGSAPGYGGCAVWLSVDGGATYGSSPIGIIKGRQTMGLVYNANYPSHADPDNVDTLDVDLTESLGTLLPVSATAQNAFGSLWYLAGGGTIVVNGITLTIPYELGAYQGASLLAANKYGLTPPNRRGVFNTPVAAHNIGTPFSFLLDGTVFAMNLSSSLIGLPLFFKFTAFNATGGNQQSLASATPYSFTPTGLVGWAYNVGGTGGTGTSGGQGGPYIIPYFEGDPALTSPQGGQLLLSHQIPSSVLNHVLLPAGLTGSEASCKTAPTGAVTITIKQNGTSIGTINFAGGATTGTFTFASLVTLNPGDVLDFVMGSADTTFAGLFFTIAGTRN